MVLRSNLPRSRILQLLPALLPAATWRPLPAIAVGGVSSGDQGQIAGDKAFQPGLAGKDYGKSEMSYDDFTKRPSGMAFKEAKPGNGKSPVAGDRVVVDWSGYTIGYFGRPFETKKLQELDEKDGAYTRFEVGKGEVIPGLEEAVLGMAEGGVRQIVVPPEIGYPDSDPSHERVGPKPSTFSGQRALDFVLQNQQLIDKTLLFNVKLVRVDAR